jgi:PAS domain S-box-containing protein
MTVVPDPPPPQTPRDSPLERGDAFRLLVEAVEDYAIFLLSADGEILTWNPGAERIKGYRADEIVGRHFSLFYTPEERAADRPMRLLAWAAEHGRFEDEGWRVRKDGTRFWADVVVTALRDPDGRTYGFAKITRDLTERRASEEQERQLLAEQRARAAAEEALRARDRFLSIASHELKTPIASVRLSAESLQRARALGRLGEDRLDAGLVRLITAADRLGTLVEELLDISRLTSDRVHFETRSIDLVRLAGEVIERFGEVERSGRIRIEAERPTTAQIDPSRMDQVITNLVDNALKYSDPSTEVVVAVRMAAAGAEVEVLDRGRGLGPDSDNLFEAFGRGTNVEDVPGIGLGLHISRQIVERHGGTIRAERRADGPGSRFVVTLPSGTSAS